MLNSQVIFSTTHRTCGTRLPHQSLKILKENLLLFKSESQIQRGTVNEPSNANDLYQVLKLAEEVNEPLNINNYLKF